MTKDDVHWVQRQLALDVLGKVEDTVGTYRHTQTEPSPLCASSDCLAP